MKDPPHPKQEKIFRKFFDFIFVAAIIQTIVNLALYFYGLHEDSLLGIGTRDLDLPSHARTLVFSQIVLFELLLVFVCKDEKKPTWKSLTNNKALIYAVLFSFVLQLLAVYNPFLQEVFRTTPLLFSEWMMLVLGSSTAFLVPPITNSIRKLYRK